MSTDFSSLDCDLMVIHTNLYAGNFEREMAAFITGEIGDCGVGREDVHDKYNYDYSMFEGIIEHIPDDHGVTRPVTIYPNPYYKNNGLGFHYRVDDPDGCKKAVEAYKEYVRNDQQSWIDNYTRAIKGYEEEGEESKEYKEYKRAGWDIDSLRNEVKVREQKIEDVKDMTVDDFEGYDAYNSVAIPFCEGHLTDELIGIIKERAQEFINVFNDPDSSRYFARKRYSDFAIEYFEVVEVRVNQTKRKV